jgi:hypothetical protein
VRRARVDPKLVRPVICRPHRIQTIFQIAAAITGDGSAFASALGIHEVTVLRQGAPPVIRSRRTRHWFRPFCTRSWQAGYNLACAYAAVIQARRAAGADQSELRELTSRVVSSLEFTVCNPECEMERPCDWIATDPISASCAPARRNPSRSSASSSPSRNGAITRPSPAADGPGEWAGRPQVSGHPGRTTTMSHRGAPDHDDVTSSWLRPAHHRDARWS